MDKYLSVKLLSARAINLGDYNKYRGWTIPEDENPLEEGFLVQDKTGRESYIPKDIFEMFSFKLAEDNKITDGDVEHFMDGVDVMKLDKKTTLVSSTTLTGFVSHEVASCVDPKNYDEAIGIKIGTERIKNKIYPCLGFVLQWALNGLKNK